MLVRLVADAFPYDVCKNMLFYLSAVNNKFTTFVQLSPSLVGRTTVNSLFAIWLTLSCIKNTKLQGNVTRVVVVVVGFVFLDLIGFQLARIDNKANRSKIKQYLSIKLRLKLASDIKNYLSLVLNRRQVHCTQQCSVLVRILWCVSECFGLCL